MFGKVNPAPAVSKSIRMVFRSLLAPLKFLKPLKTIQKHDINENPGFFGFLTPFPIGILYTLERKRDQRPAASKATLILTKEVMICKY